MFNVLLFCMLGYAWLMFQGFTHGNLAKVETASPQVFCFQAVGWIFMSHSETSETRAETCLWMHRLNRKDGLSIFSLPSFHWT